MQLERKNSASGEFVSAREKRRRRRWLILAATVVCVPFLIYAIAASVGSGTSEAPVSSKSGSNNSGSDDPGGANGSSSPEADKQKKTDGEKSSGEKPEYKRTAALPAPAASCDDLRVLVDHTHSLPSGYVPPDLVSLQSYGISTLDAGPLLRREAARHLARLMAAATEDGEELIVASAYRSYAEQEQTFAQFTGVYGDETDTVSAPPGQSQHQLGTAVDFTNSTAGYRLWWPFGDTTASDWLLQNAPDYGYVLAYPDGKEAETGYQWEPWHYRYVGVENAERISLENVTLQKFLVREDVLPRC